MALCWADQPQRRCHTFTSSTTVTCIRLRPVPLMWGDERLDRWASCVDGGDFASDRILLCSRRFSATACPRVLHQQRPLTSSSTPLPLPLRSGLQSLGKPSRFPDPAPPTNWHVSARWRHRFGGGGSRRPVRPGDRMPKSRPRSPVRRPRPPTRNGSCACSLRHPCAGRSQPLMNGLSHDSSIRRTEVAGICQRRGSGGPRRQALSRQMHTNSAAGVEVNPSDHPARPPWSGSHAAVIHGKSAT